MKFAHLADCHLGGWREPQLRDLGLKAFDKAMDICIEENTAFVLIAGDLFNNALPPIDLLKEVTNSLRKLKDNDISCYIIPGSHDFSISGKTMLDVLEKAGLVENVAKLEDNKLKFTIDKTNTKITGLFGLKGGLDKNYYENIDKESLEKETGFKIFMFHTTLTEFKPKDMENVKSESVNIIPKNFNYYAGGHPHYVFHKDYPGYGMISFPGPLFPNNFSELEKLQHGSFYIITANEKLDIKQIPLKFHDVISFNIDVNNKTATEAEKIILDNLNQDVTNKIVTLRIHGTLTSGKINDINFNEILSKLESAYVVLKNTNALTTKEFEAIKMGGNVEDIEKALIKEHIKDTNIKEEPILNLMESLSSSKEEGETTSDFENRLLKDTLKSLNLEETWKNAA